MRSGSFTANTLGVLTIGGSVVAGTAAHTGELFFGEIRGAVSIGGDLAGQANHRAVLITVGAFDNVSLPRVSIGGSVRFADVLFGFEPGRIPRGSFTRIGSLCVAGAWMAGNLSVGINAGDDGVFGTADDRYNSPDSTIPPPSIGHLEIGGRILGTADGADAFGIVASRIGELIVEGRNRPLAPGAGNDNFALGTPGDIRLREVPRPVKRSPVFTRPRPQPRGRRRASPGAPAAGSSATGARRPARRSDRSKRTSRRVSRSGW